jgi:hypothetical protein
MGLLSLSDDDFLVDLKVDLNAFKTELVRVGVPLKLIEAIHRKCLRTPRRQTGRADRRTNREPRWAIATDHPDYSTEKEGHLVWLKLLTTMTQMKNAPKVDADMFSNLATKYLPDLQINAITCDPVTDQPLDYIELVKDVVTEPTHGYSRFHIGHQDPRFHPKHVNRNIRWQLKASNDFQGTMDIRVARIAFQIDQFTRTSDVGLLQNAKDELKTLAVSIIGQDIP